MACPIPGSPKGKSNDLYCELPILWARINLLSQKNYFPEVFHWNNKKLIAAGFCATVHSSVTHHNQCDCLCEWRNKTLHILSVASYSTKKRNEIQTYGLTQIKLRNLMINEREQMQKLIPFLKNFLKRQTYKDRRISNCLRLSMSLEIDRKQTLKHFGVMGMT